MDYAKKVSVAHVGPDSRGRGGMASVTRVLFDTELAHEFELQPITTHQMGSKTTRLLTFARGLVEFIRWARLPGPRVAHVHATVRGSFHRKVLLIFIAKMLGVPVLLHVHAGGPEIATFHERLGLLRRRLLRTALRLSDSVVAVSLASARELEERCAVSHVEVLPNPAPRPWAPSIRSGSAPEVLYLGGFANPAKGGNIMLEALPSLRAVAPGARVTLAGPGILPSSAGILKEDPFVSWAGWLDDKAKVDALRRASVVVLPSVSEGMPMAMLEAMAAGTAVVATRVGGIPDVAVDGQEALLLDPGDATGLAEAIGSLVTDLEHARRLGDAARERAAGMGPDVIAGRLAVLYRELADHA